VEHLLTSRLRQELDELLVVDSLLGRTRLAWLGLGPTSSSPAAVKAELEKLAYLRRLDAHTLDLSMLPAERRRFLAGLGRRLTAQALARREPDRRYPILLTLLAQSSVDVLDEVLLLFDQAVSGRESAARTRLTEALAERARGGEDRQHLLDEILAIVLDPAVGDEQVGPLLRSRVGLDRMRAAWAARRERLPRDHGHLALMDASMAYLRQFAPAVLTAVRFAGGPGTEELLTAVEILTGLYATGARKVPEGATAGFVPARWAGYLAKAVQAGDVTAYRRYWELCVLLGLRDGLRSGTCTSRTAAATPTRPRSCSRRTSGHHGGWSSASWSASPPPRPTRWLWPRPSCTAPCWTWNGCSPPVTPPSATSGGSG
jgi:hypothetical protein